MTVKELIEELNKIESKEKSIIISNIKDYPFVHGVIKEVTESEEGAHHIRINR